MKSEFAVWFKKQFGGVPITPRKYNTLLAKRERLRYVISQIDDILLRDRRFVDKYDAALKAWMVK